MRRGSQAGSEIGQRDIPLGGRRIRDQQQRIMPRLRVIQGVEKRLFVGLPRVVHNPATGLADEQPPQRGAPRPWWAGQYRRAHGPYTHMVKMTDGAAIAFAQQECLALLRSEEHTSELQSLMRISYAVFCLKNKHNSK